eukprot:gene12331-30730_t
MSVDDFKNRRPPGMTCTEVATGAPPPPFEIVPKNTGSSGSECTMYRGIRAVHATDVDSRLNNNNQNNTNNNDNNRDGRSCLAGPDEILTTPEAQPESTTAPAESTLTDRTTASTYMTTGPTFQYWTTAQPDGYNDAPGYGGDDDNNGGGGAGDRRTRSRRRGASASASPAASTLDLDSSRHIFVWAGAGLILLGLAQNLRRHRLSQAEGLN